MLKKWSFNAFFGNKLKLEEKKLTEERLHGGWLTAHWCFLQNIPCVLSNQTEWFRSNAITVITGAVYI